MRTSYVTVSRARACCLPAGRKGDWVVENPAHCGYVRASIAGSGAHDAADRGFHPTDSRTTRCCRCRGSHALVFDDEGSEETCRANDDFGDARIFPRKYGNATRVFGKYIEGIKTASVLT